MSTVGVYTRTSITTDKYERYEKALLLYCKQQGWGDVKYYRDRAGGTADEKELERMAMALGEALSGRKPEGFDAVDFGRRLAEMSQTDAEHDRENLRRLMADINSGVVQAVVVHDLSQLGKSKIAAFNVLSAMMNKVEVHMPTIGKIQSNTTLPCGEQSDYF